jgi:hypothetical protein
MFKKTAEHSQRTVLGTDAINRQGVDQTVWKNEAELEYLKMRDELNQLQVDSAALLAQIKLSQARVTGSVPGAPMPRSGYVAALQRRDAIVKKILELEARMRPVKEKIKVAHRQGTNSLENAFLVTAKEMLASDVFNRIFIAAAHRCGMDLENDDRLGKNWKLVNPGSKI